MGSHRRLQVQGTELVPGGGARCAGMVMCSPGNERFLSERGRFMSPRAAHMTGQIVIRLILVLGFAVASFTAVALGASLCDLRKELQKAESELQELQGLRSSKAQFEEDQRRAEALIHGDPSSPDPNGRMG